MVIKTNASSTSGVYMTGKQAPEGVGQKAWSYIGFEYVGGVCRKGGDCIGKALQE